MPINSFLYPGAKGLPPFQSTNSLIFDGSTDYLTRTQGSATNQKKGTVSFWIKRTKLGSNMRVITNYNDSNNYAYIRFNSDDQLQHYVLSGGSAIGHLKTTRVFKDPSAWMHVVLIIDTTQGTAANRIKIYVNGVQETDFATETYPDQNADHPLFAASASNNHFIGRHNTDSQYLNGYLGEFVKIDGTAEAQTSFGEFDTDSPSIWKPIDPSGLTFGNNGYYLDFEDSSALGADVSGNSNSFTVNNFDATKAHSTDNCSNNLATLNPIKVLGPASTQFQEGNMQFSATNSNWANTFSTIAFTKGKWYAEFKVVTLASSTGYGSAGIADINLAGDNTSASTINVNGETAGVIFDHRSGQSALKSGGSSVTTNIGNFSTNDIVGMAVDMYNKALYVHINGTYYQISSVTGVPTSGSSKTGAITIPASVVDCAFTVGSYSDKSETAVNFGSPFYSISSSNSDANGHGDFEYAVPSGYYTLNTKNLAEFG